MFNKDIFNSATIEGMLAAPGEKWHRDPKDVIPLWLADPDFPTSPAIRKAIQEAVDDEDFYYPDKAKPLPAIVNKINTRNGLKVAADDVMLTQGVNPIFWLAARYACKQGEEAILLDPVYDPFAIGLEAAGAKPVHWNVDSGDGYKYNVEALKKAVTPKTKLLMLCNPHNPAGRVLTREELKAIADVAVDRNLTVLVDELWEDIIYDGRKHVTLASLSPEIESRTITAWGFSKTWGVAGLQAGYVACTNKKTMGDLRKLSAGILRGTNSIALRAIPEMLDYHNDYWKKDMIAHLTKMRETATKRLTEMGCKVPELQGTYLMFPKYPCKAKSVEVEKHLRENAKVAVSPGSLYGPSGEGHIRVLIATSEEILGEGLNRIEKGLKSIK